MGGLPQGPLTTDPAGAALLMTPLEQQQQAELQDFIAKQQQAAFLALIAGMKTQPNPAAQAAVSEPGYPTPPPALGM